MVTLDGFLLEKYEQGMIDEEQVITKSQDPTTVMAKLQEIHEAQAAAEAEAQG
jgi:hypothetical protein